jgi:hypothetical protein
LATIVQLVCAGILVGAWAWGRAFWRWRYRSSPAGPTPASEHGERHLAVVPTSPRDEDTRPPDISGRHALIERLAAAEGAAVYNAEGKQLGLFSEVVGAGSEVAIRHDGAFVWRRRVLPVATVEAVLPEHGARGAVVLNIADKRLEHAADTPTSASDEEPAEHYLLFVPTAEGYELVEREGSAPAILDDVSMAGDEDAFCVIKVARSPLPGDGRLCAYLEPR